MNEKDFVLGVLGQTLNMAPDQLAGLIYTTPEGADSEKLADNAQEQVLTLYKTHLDGIKANGQTHAQQQYSRGVKEGAQTLEKLLKTTFQLQTPAFGEDLVKELQATVSKTKTGTDDDVKKHPLFLSLEQRVQAEVEQARAEAAAQIEQERLSFKREFAKTRALTTAKTTAKSLGLVIPGEETQQDALLSVVLGNSLSQYQFEEQQDGGFLVLDSEGKRVENEMQHPVAFADLVKKVATQYFPVQAQGQKGSAGNNSSQPGAAGGWKFKDTQDFESQWMAETDTAKRNEMTTAFSNQFRPATE